MRPRQFWMVELKWLNHENTKQHNNLGVSEKKCMKMWFLYSSENTGRKCKKKKKFDIFNTPLAIIVF